LKADSPLDSTGIPEFQLIPADSLDSPWILGGISGGMKSIAGVFERTWFEGHCAAWHMSLSL